ncbi:zinc finger protein [Hirsutella rhossiliensis]|uniref:Zinc finger protein n=1 Tax=Hirsutella rhossiliensis TaxID=111463 RepID=A0A9P8SJP8_9HYPO|nr:zinc finger protein [Hirsutella rhossiliensis]KAH0965523.1 zinc finger protein [Hirsutella rhossiliensis]
MDSPRRTSFEEASITSSSLRRWCLTSAANRSWARRSTASSSDSASASFVEGSERQAATCVARETSGNDCVLHSFVVWAAVKRNASVHMSLADKRRCPLLQCREQFVDHELMLQHLYSCPHMASGEYWCYDCDRVEQLGDAKCRRCCLGHASKRKKVMSMAKSFFGSLGHHKSRNRGLADVDTDVDGQMPPSYESVMAAVPEGAELQANEIFEADSLELAVPEPELAASPAAEAQGLCQSDPIAAFLPRLIQQPVMPPPLSPPPPPQPSVPFEPSRGPSNPPPVRAPERPVLQVNTHGLDHRQVRRPRRSKDLTPSSSVRSTSSATSTASHEISPLSIWSGAWSRGHGFESTLTSPADDLTNLADLWPQPKHAGHWLASEGQEMNLARHAPDIVMAELAADNPFAEPTADVPMLDYLSDDPFSGDLDLGQPDFAFNDTATSVVRSADASMTLPSTDVTNFSLETTPLEAEPPRHEHVSANLLAQSVRKTLQVHVESSVDRLGNDENPLAQEFCQMTACSVAVAGLEAMENIFEGHPETSPVKLLCFVHVVYSFSLMVHEQDAFNRSMQFFAQAVAYSCWLPHQDMQSYILAVGLLWKPESMADDAFAELQRASLSRSGSKSLSPKGKERADVPGRFRCDPLLLAAQHVLDELEMTALCETQRLEDQASELCMEHLREGGLLAGNGSPFSMTANNIAASLARQYNAVPGFESAMQHVLDEFGSGPVATPRLLELHLVQAGKMLLHPSIDIDEYVLSVRKQVDTLYEGQTPHTVEVDPRRRFYRLDIRLLMRLIVQEIELGDEALQDTSGASRADGLLEPLANEQTRMDVDSHSSAFDSMPGSGFALPTDMVDIAAGISRPPVPEIAIHPPPPDEGGSTAGLEQTTGSWPSCTTTPASPAAAAASRNAAAVSCCEICGYRPRGDPRWFGGSMAKHKKLQHGTGPPTIYRCPYPGCNSQYRSRKDNLRQHQIDKKHFVNWEDGGNQRGGKRKRME